MSICVLTAIFGEYDNPWPFLDQDIDCDALIISDRPYSVPGWRNILAQPTLDSPRMAAKEPRCLPQLWTDADIIVWLDAHLEVRSRSFVRELVSQLGDGRIGMFRHTYHRAISQEARLASQLDKYRGYDLLGQVRHYLDEGHPDSWGMWTTGVMVRRPSDTLEFGNVWLDEIKRWGPEDQISLPYALRRTIGYPVDLPFEGWWEGKRFLLHRHNDGTG